MSDDMIGLNLGSSVLDGLNMPIDPGAPPPPTVAMGEGQGHAMYLEDEDVQRGPLSVRLKGEWSAYHRFCVYWRQTATLKVYKNADDSLLNRPEATLIVTIARTRGAPHELAVRTHDGETVTCVASTNIEAMKWLEAFSAAQSTAMYGYIFVSRKKDWKRRWAIYQRSTRTLCLYQARESDLTSTLAFYAQAIEAPFRGSLVVSHAVKKAAPKLPFGFMCYSDDGQAMHLSADGPDDLDKWLEAMPSLGGSQPAAGTESSDTLAPLGGGGPRNEPKPPRMKHESSRLESAMMSAMRAEVAQLRAKVAEKKAGRESRFTSRLSARNSARESSRRPDVGLVWLDDESNRPPPPPAEDEEESVVLALEQELTVALSTAALAAHERPPPPTKGRSTVAEFPMEVLPEEGESERESQRRDSVMSSRTEAEEEEEREAELAEYAFLAAQAEADWAIDDDDDEFDVPPELHVGLSAEQLVAHAKPVLSEGGRENLRQDSGVAKELEELKAMLEAARQENLKLKVEVGGATSASEDEAQMQKFVELLRGVVQMRRDGKFDKELFENYNGAMVELSDDHVKEMYQSFMLLYVGEADAALLERLGIGEVDDAVIGFAEMMSIKLGELIDQPRHVRVQAFRAEKQKKADRERERLARAERQAEEAAAVGKLKAVNKLVFESHVWVWELLAAAERAEGVPEAEAKRYGRKAELKLLLMDSEEVRRLSSYNWQNMTCSGLKPHEMRGLLHMFAVMGSKVPKNADAFVSNLRERVTLKLPSPEEQLKLALC